MLVLLLRWRGAGTFAVSSAAQGSRCAAPTPLSSAAALSAALPPQSPRSPPNKRARGTAPVSPGDEIELGEARGRMNRASITDDDGGQEAWLSGSDVRETCTRAAEEWL